MGRLVGGDSWLGSSGRSWTEVHLCHIFRTFRGSFTSESGGLGSCGGRWILGLSYTTCSAVSSPFPHFLQMVSTSRPSYLPSKIPISHWRRLLHGYGAELCGPGGNGLEVSFC